MKKGPDKRKRNDFEEQNNQFDHLKKLKIEEEELSIDSLPDEILTTIFKNIPSVYFVRDQSINKVCKKWHAILQDKSFDAKNTVVQSLKIARKILL